MNMLKIEKAQVLHIQGIQSAFDAVAREGRYFSSSEALALDHFAPWMESNLHDIFPQIVALDGDTVVGWSIICCNDQPYLRHCGTLFIGLLADWRGHGIGRRMLAASLDGARRGGLARIELEVYEHNHNAIALYRRMGFKVEGLKPRAHLIGTDFRDVVCMGQLLAPSRARSVESPVRAAAVPFSAAA
ncbi:MAG TPA: GNAT family N-acetyltransferase [Burkholderiaceae bacterium]